METKLCPYCKQSITIDSKKCPNCKEWVDRRIKLTRQLWIVPFFLLVFLVPWIMDRTMLRENKFWQQPDAVTIISHHTGQGEEGDLCVIGTMKNTSKIPWDFITVQVDYFNSNGQLVDTSQDSGSETLAPGQERSFKVVFEKKQKGVEYDHYRIFVTGADDASRF